MKSMSLKTSTLQFVRPPSFFLLATILLLGAPSRGGGHPSQNRDDEGADLVVVSDKIFTSEAAAPWVEAFAVENGEFTYVGDALGALEHLGSATVFIDATGEMVVPGFIDNHCHYLWIGALTSMMPWNLLNCEDVESVKTIVRRTARENPDLPFVGGIGWRLDYIPGGAPTKEDLDEAVADRPVLLMSYGGQSGWANTKAVTLMESMAPEAFEELSPQRDDDGEATGFFRRFHCFDPFQFFTKEEMSTAERPMIGAMWRSVNEALSLGITTINDVQIYKGFYPYLKKFKDQGGLRHLRARGSMYVGPGMFDDVDELKADLAWWISLSRDGESDAHLKLGDSIKLYIDGVGDNHTAFLFEPYSDDPTTVGQPDWSQEDFNAVIALIDSLGLQACTHACGDAGANRVINAYENAATINPFWDRRHRIEHCELTAATDQARMAALGVLAAMQPTHYFFSPTRAATLGPERMKRIMPWRTLIDDGVHLSFGSDWCAGPGNPAYGLFVAATRLNSEFEAQTAPDETVSFEEAIHAYTLESAHALKMDEEIGSIKVGKQADFVIFDEDLTNVTTYRHILSQREMGSGLDNLVLATFVDGEIAYCKTDWTMPEAGKASVKFSFRKIDADHLTINGTLAWPDFSTVAGADVRLTVGDLVWSFIMDDKGRGTSTDGGAALTMTPGRSLTETILGYHRFKLKVKRAPLFDGLKTYGFVNDALIKRPGESRTVPMVFAIEGELRAAMIDFVYTARPEARGSGKGQGRPFTLPTLLDTFWDWTF